MQILSDYFYTASELQKIVNLILEKLNTSLHLQINGCRFCNIFFFFFFTLPCNIELCLYQLIEEISHWPAVLLKAWYRQCGCFIAAEGNIQEMSLDLFQECFWFQVFGNFCWCRFTVLLSVSRWAVTEEKACNFKMKVPTLKIRSY